MTSIQIRILAMVAFILTVGALSYLVGEYASLQWLIEHESGARDFIREQPGLTWWMGLGVYTTMSFIPGTVGKSVVCGWLYGFWPAVLLVDAGLTVAATVCFSVARWVARDIVRARLHFFVGKLDRHLERDGAFYLVMLRVAHVPFTLINYGAALTSVRLLTFVWTTAVGVLPGTMIFVFVGTRIPTVEELVTKGPWQLLDPLLFGVLSATVVIPWMIREGSRHFRNPGRGMESETLNSNSAKQLPDNLSR